MLQQTHKDTRWIFFCSLHCLVYEESNKQDSCSWDSLYIFLVLKETKWYKQLYWIVSGNGFQWVIHKWCHVDFHHFANKCHVQFNISCSKRHTYTHIKAKLKWNKFINRKWKKMKKFNLRNWYRFDHKAIGSNFPHNICPHLNSFISGKSFKIWSIKEIRFLNEHSLIIHCNCCRNEKTSRTRENHFHKHCGKKDYMSLELGGKSEDIWLLLLSCVYIKHIQPYFQYNVSAIR